MPLSGIRVLDFTRHLPGPYATDLLRRLGAEIIKIEPPDGDPTRWVPPFAGVDGALYVLVNAGKRSVAVDLKNEQGRAFIHRLASSCDVAVESYRPGMAAEFDVDAETLRRINPRLIYCSISGFGSGSQRSAHDLNFVALAGLLDLQRDSNGRPVLPSTQIGDMAGAMFAALAILAAIIDRGRTGSGKVIDISMSDATRAMMPAAEALYRGTHHTPETFFLTGALPNYNVYRTADAKYLAVAALEPRFWEAFCEAIGHPELVQQQFEVKHHAEVRRKIESTIASKRRDEWESIFEGLDACVEPVLTIEEAHSRFGDPMGRHPLQTNFPAPPAQVDPIGAAFDEAARLAGLSGGETAAAKKGGAFRTKGGLKKLILRAHQKVTGS